MPMIHLEYDDTKVSKAEATSLSIAVRDIVSEATGIEDVFVYGNSAQIKIKIAPVEIFVRMSDHKVKDIDELFDVVKGQLSAWKNTTGFAPPISLTIIPMHWKFETNI